MYISALHCLSVLTSRVKIRVWRKKNQSLVLSLSACLCLCLCLSVCLSVCVSVLTLSISLQMFRAVRYQDLLAGVQTTRLTRLLPLMLTTTARCLATHGETTVTHGHLECQRGTLPSLTLNRRQMRPFRRRLKYLTTIDRLSVQFYSPNGSKK